MESKMEEQRRKPKRGSGDDDDDGALRCKVLMGISAAGLKEQSRCMCVCVSVCMAESTFTSLSAVLPLRDSNCDPCSVKIHIPLDQHEDITRTQLLLPLLQWTNEDITRM